MTIEQVTSTESRCPDRLRWRAPVHHAGPDLCARRTLTLVSTTTARRAGVSTSSGPTRFIQTTRWNAGVKVRMTTHASTGPASTCRWKRPHEVFLYLHGVMFSPTAISLTRATCQTAARAALRPRFPHCVLVTWCAAIHRTEDRAPEPGRRLLLRAKAAKRTPVAAGPTPR